eukprot:GHRQ01017971.1.p1 GENE.GHRQ01017971.1~~GHRQ01017971.1.p1  ORF type:complete len:225 (+),score=95.27 GHRQ01017971.1:213-887(+)
MKPLWFCIVSCHLLWFTYAKAQLNVLWKKVTKKTVVFKSTKKKGEEDGRDAKKRRFCALPQNVGDMEGTLDAWVLVASFSISMITAIVGAFQMIDRPYTAQGDFRWFLALSIFWSVYNMIPPALFIFYCYNKGQLFEDFCSFCMTLSFMVGIGGIVCTWLVPGGCQDVLLARAAAPACRQSLVDVSKCSASPAPKACDEASMKPENPAAGLSSFARQHLDQRCV